MTLHLTLLLLRSNSCARQSKMSGKANVCRLYRSNSSSSRIRRKRWCPEIIQESDALFRPLIARSATAPPRSALVVPHCLHLTGLGAWRTTSPSSYSSGNRKPRDFNMTAVSTQTPLCKQFRIDLGKLKVEKWNLYWRTHQHLITSWTLWRNLWVGKSGIAELYTGHFLLFHTTWQPCF